VAVLAYVVSGLGGIVDWLKPLQKYSPFYQYSGHEPLVNGLDGSRRQKLAHNSIVD
jgi:ABC-2 type transport system permease protein